MKDEKTLIEWAILIGLFNATVEQTSFLTGQTKQDAKVIFNRFTKEGIKLQKIIEKHSALPQLEEVTETIENSIHELRKKIKYED